jgi:hypothetical protein
MNRHALLIGSQIQDLAGPHNDIEAMGKLLSKRGFEIVQRTGPDASRDGILEAYRSLIARVTRDDAVVVYYSGHGGWAEDSTGRRLQYILPTDWVDDEDRFCGILDAELSRLLVDLTERATNVAVILDCCHSSMLSRGRDATAPKGRVSRAMPGRWTPGITEFVATHTPERTYVTGNPYAVRLVACEADREAFEADHWIDGKWVRRGILTRALECVLEESGADALSWRGITDRVREQVLSVDRLQRPSIEGPADRVLFTTSELARPDAVVYFEDQGTPALRTSRILGARVGIPYDIVRRGQTVPSAESIVATATITALPESKALVAITDQKEPPLPGALAFPRTSPFPAMTVVVEGDNPALLARLERSTLVESAPRATARFVLATSGTRLLLTDTIEEPPYVFELNNDDNGRELAAKRIERWAKAEALRDLRSNGMSGEAIALTWGSVVNGKLIEKSPGERFHVDDMIYVRATNATQRPLFMWIFDVGISGKVTLLTVAGLGQATQPGKSISIGENDGQLRGLRLSWAPDVAIEIGARRESIVVIAADHWADVTVFETPLLRARGHGGPSPLQTLLRTLGAGASREISSEGGDQRFCVKRIDFDLYPGRA